MAFYENRGGKRPPRNRNSIGPEEGYRPRGGAKKPIGRIVSERWEGAPPYEHKGKPPVERREGKPPFERRGGKPPFERREGKPPFERREGKPPFERREGKPPFERRPTPPPYERRPAPPPPPPVVLEDDLPRENLLAGRNPIREAIRSGRDIERLLVARGDLSGSAREIVSMARERRIVVQSVDRSRLDELSPGHQGMIAFASAFRYSTLEDMLALAKARDEDALLVILDGLTDPHNLGAIIRSAECAGAHGVIVPERRAVGLTPAAVKASAGAVEHLPVAREANLTRLIAQLQGLGFWVTAADMGGEPYDKADLTGKMALVVGGEGGGVSRLVLEKCDRRVAIPIRGKIESLNASVAAGVLLYEIVRQRG